MRGDMRRALLLAATGLCGLLVWPGAALSAPEEDGSYLKELNFVFLHGVGGHSCAFQRLSDAIERRLPVFASFYGRTNPGTTIRMNQLARCYPGYLGIDPWSRNVIDSIEEHFGDKENLILVGHSMGGKVALHSVAQNIGNIASKVAAVITINSPIRHLDQYYAPGGGPVLEYYRTILLGSDEGAARSVVFRDSVEDGNRVGETKNWLAFISAESAPLSRQYDRGGVDPWPRNMDDGVVPISAQYADGADVVYYGQHGHSDFGAEDEVASFIADRILLYLFGQSVECSVFDRKGSLEHRADWLLGTDRWDDVLGEVLVSSGTVRHSNESWTEWRDWEDVIGECSAGGYRSRTHITQVSLPVLTRIEEVHWLSAEDAADCRFYLKTKVAPRNTMVVDWVVYGRGLLPEGTKRGHYEVEITDGTPLATATNASWVTSDPRDVRLRLWSEAQSPFRWFKVEWRVYHRESRQRGIIDNIPATLLTAD